MSQSTSSEVQNRESDDSNNSKPAEQELVFILENGTEPIPVRAVKKPEPKLNAPIRVPFPPTINAADLIRTNKNGALLARCTNKFLIYRNEFAKEVRTQGYNISMSEISCLAAQAWKQEPNYVIRKYADIAHEVKWLHKQLSKSNSRNRMRVSSNSSSLPVSSVDVEQTIYTTQQKRTNLLTQQFLPETFRNNLYYQQQRNNLSPLISSPLTPTMPSIYHPRISEVFPPDITIPSVNSMMFPSNHVVSPAANLEMIQSYEIPIDYCSEPLSMGVW